jgi:transcriptional regulator with XRE-family HTH domain
MAKTEWHERLKARAKDLELADAEVARRVGLSQARYQNYVAGRREPDFATLLRICHILQTSPDALLGLNDGRENGSRAMRSIQVSLAAMDQGKLGLAADLLRVLAHHASAVPPPETTPGDLPDQPSPSAGATRVRAARKDR